MYYFKCLSKIKLLILFEVGKKEKRLVKSLAPKTKNRFLLM